LLVWFFIKFAEETTETNAIMILNDMLQQLRGAG